MWNGTCSKFVIVDASRMADWISAIPFKEWPQQHPVDNQLRPAMVSDPKWHDFGFEAMVFLADNPCYFSPRIGNMMLSVVMPGHRIEPHQDVMEATWVCRVHIPLVTNPAAKFIIEGHEYRLRYGSAYKVNISREHSVMNDGAIPRIHFMYDCYES
jgi:hypothetical protein